MQSCHNRHTFPTHFLKGLENSLTDWRSTVRVLPSDELSVLSTAHNLRTPRLIRLDKLATILGKLSLKHERHVSRKLYLVLLNIGETSNLVSVDKIASIAELDVREGRRSVTHSADNLSRLVELGDQLLRLGVGCEVEHGTMSTDVKDGIELGGFSDEVAENFCILPEGRLLGEELLALWVIFEGLDTAGVERRFTALGRGDCDFCFAFELVVWVSELGKIPAGRVSSVAQLVVRAENLEMVSRKVGIAVEG